MSPKHPPTHHHQQKTLQLSPDIHPAREIEGGRDKTASLCEVYPLEECVKEKEDLLVGDISYADRAEQKTNCWEIRLFTLFQVCSICVLIWAVFSLVARDQILGDLHRHAHTLTNCWLEGRVTVVWLKAEPRGRIFTVRLRGGGGEQSESYCLNLSNRGMIYQSMETDLAFPVSHSCLSWPISQWWENTQIHQVRWGEVRRATISTTDGCLQNYLFQWRIK